MIAVHSPRVLVTGLVLVACAACGTTTNNITEVSPGCIDGGADASAPDGDTSDGAAPVEGMDGAARAPDASGGDDTPGPSADAGSAARYFGTLPAWPKQKPDYDGPAKGGADAGVVDYLTGTNGITYECTTQEYSLTKTPTQIVTFNPNVDVLWPGALLQGGPFQKGQLVGLPITERAPMAVSIPTLLTANNSKVVDHPTVATVQSAVGDIIASAVDAGIQASSSISYTQTETHSAQQMALALGFSASYVGNDLSAQLNLSQSANLNTVVGYFVQNMFTVTVPEPEYPSDLFRGLTQVTLDDLERRGEIGPNNLPIYVASVVYGRIMMFSISSAQSTQQIESALSAQFHGGVASGSLDAQYSALLSDSSTSFRVVTVGGSAENAEALIASGDPSKFFGSDPAISTGVPISYVVRNLSDNSVAGVSETTSYSVKTCSASTVEPGANYYVLDFNGKLLGFDADGNEVPLMHPVSLPGGATPVNFNALAYGAKSDRLFMAVNTSSSTSAVYIYGPDGTSYGSFSVPFPGQVAGLAYDAMHARLYVTGLLSAGATSPVTYSYTESGQYIDQLASTSGTPIGCNENVLYVPTNNEIYCLSVAPNRVSAYNFGLYSQVTLPSGAFGAISGGGNYYGLRAAYDPINDRVLIGNQSSAYSFTKTGTVHSNFDLPGYVQGLAYDVVNHRVAAAMSNGTVSLFDDDGVPIALAPGAFSGFGLPMGFVFRP